MLAVTPVSQWVSQWVIDSFRFGDSYGISELSELVSTNVFSQSFFHQRHPYNITTYRAGLNILDINLKYLSCLHLFLLFAKSVNIPGQADVTFGQLH